MAAPVTPVTLNHDDREQITPQMALRISLLGCVEIRIRCAPPPIGQLWGRARSELRLLQRHEFRQCVCSEGLARSLVRRGPLSRI